MEKDRKIKMLSIIALVFAIAGMSLGFAAFSSTLNISSSATVTPNSDDFLIKVYGFNQSKSLTDMGEGFDPSWLSETEGHAYVYSTDTTMYTPAVISRSNNNTSISNISVQITNDMYFSAEYYFFITNEGAYAANIEYSQFERFYSNTYSKECSYDDNTTPVLAEKTCDNINLYIALTELDETELLNSATQTTVDFNSGYSLQPGETIFMCIGIKADDAAALPDGNMTIEFGDINLEFTTTPISN